MGNWHKKPIEIEPRVLLTKYIDDGAIVCEKIKKIYHPDVAWKDCYRLVAEIFTGIKIKTRPFSDAKYDNEFIEALSQYSEEDLKSIYEHP